MTDREWGGQLEFAMAKMFTQMQLQAIADALGDTSEGLTGSEIHHLLLTSKIMDIDPPATKRHRLYNAFVAYQNAMQDRRHLSQIAASSG